MFSILQEVVEFVQLWNCSFFTEKIFLKTITSILCFIADVFCFNLLVYPYLSGPMQEM